MTDQNIPADQERRARQWARDTLDDVENGANVSAYARDAARTLIAMMPRPTLADMTMGERHACRWMQADVKGMKGRRVIAYPGDGGEMTQIMLPNGLVVDIDPENVTPRPDLPRWEWPGNKKPAPALPEGWRLADHKDHGRVIVTTTTPNRDGRFYYVLPVAVVPHADHSQGAFRNRMGFDWRTCDPAELTYIDHEGDQ